MITKWIFVHGLVNPYHGRMELLRRFVRDERGQDLIEYTLLMAFVALASASLFISAGGNVQTIWQSANTSLSNAAGQAGS
jgi:Flp pilus assembly pilin Flp